VRALAIVMLLATHALAEPKPTLVVAGIDGVESESIPLATKLTQSLQTMKAGRYQLKGTAKQITAALVKAECRVTQAACAAAVGAELGADYVLAGDVHYKGSHQVLVLSLVDVKTKRRVRSIRDNVASTVDARKWGRLAYQKMIAAEDGALVIVANAKQGEILLDGQVAGALFDGRATLTGVANGTHQLVIRAKGYRELAVDVTVEGETRQNLLLEATP
jgi:TolB-like protein